MSTAVKLRRPQRPLFPDRCVSCGVEHPGESAVVGYSPVILAFNVARIVAVKAPTCGVCRRADRKRRLLLLPVIVALTAIQLFLMVLVAALAYSLVLNLNIPPWLWAPVFPVGLLLA